MNKTEIELKKESNELEVIIQDLVDEIDEIQERINERQERIDQISVLLKDYNTLAGALRKAADGVFLNNKERELLRALAETEEETK